MLEKSGDRRAVSGVVGMRLGDFGAGVHAALCLGGTGCAQTATRFSREHLAFRRDEFLWRNRALLAGAKSRLRPCGDERPGAGGDRYLLFLQRPARDAWTHCCEMVFLYFLPGTFGCVGRDPYHSCINKAPPGRNGAHPVNRTVKYYKIFSGSSFRAAAYFHAAA